MKKKPQQLNPGNHRKFKSVEEQIKYFTQLQKKQEQEKKEKEKK